MTREAKRTLYSLSCAYQNDVSSNDYQVIAIDNNSSLPLSNEFVESFGANFSYFYFRTESPSPAAAMNFGVNKAKAETIACIVDGARMVSPGLIKNTLTSIRAFKNPFIMSLAWQLGPNVQNISMLEGYNQTEEDKLLETINWKNNGYTLFKISTQAPSSNVGFLGGIPEELSYFAIKKTLFLQIGGFCERFQSPGGGLVNHDFLQRALKFTNTQIIIFIGEGSFHQYHGGVATNCKLDDHPFESFAQEYKEIRGTHYKVIIQPKPESISYLGTITADSARFIVRKDG